MTTTITHTSQTLPDGMGRFGDFGGAIRAGDAYERDRRAGARVRGGAI